MRILPLLLLSGLLLLAGCGASQYTGAGKGGDRLRYDYLDDEYEFAGPEEELRYNYMEDRYEYTDPESELRYNYMEDRYEYAD